MAPGDLQLHLESLTRNGIPSPFSPDRDLALPLTCASPIQERKQRAVGCAHTRVFTPSHTPTHLGSQVSCMLIHRGPFPSPVLIHAHSRLPSAYLINKTALKTHNHTLTLTRSPCPQREPAQTLVETHSDLSHLTHCPLLSQQAHSKAHQPARLHLLAHPPTPHPPARSLGCRRVLHLRGAPPPQPVHTYGKLPKVAAFSSPSARGGPLSGYQEVNGECQGGGSSTLPVR